VAPASLLLLKEEFRALADVAHPNLVPLHELFVAPSREDAFSCFFTMEHIPGRHLLDDLCDRPVARPAAETWHSDALNLDVEPAPMTSSWSSSSSTDERSGGGPADPTRIAPAFGQLAQAVHALHRQGKLHRDLKSGNVLIDEDGRVMVLDFGLVVPTRAGGAGPIVGTPATMAPEQMLEGVVGPAADWYAVGVMLHEALSGQAPFSGGDFARMAQAKAAGEAPALPADTDPEWAALCRALMEPDPERRAGFDAFAELITARSLAPTSASGERALVGRDLELAALRASWQTVCAGKAAAVFVRGRSGIGKSALVRHFLDEISSDPQVLVLSGRCHERETIPHKALDAVIDGLSHHLALQPPAVLRSLVPENAAALVRLFPVLGRHPDFASSEQVPATPAVARAMGAVALEDLLHRVARRWRVVVSIDDLQWGDSDSAALLVNISRAATRPPLLLLGSHRDEDASESPMLAALQPMRGETERNIIDLALGPLSETDARTLLEAGGVAADEALLAEAGGDPYLLAEAAMWSEGHRFTGIPDMLRARLAEAPHEVRAMVEAAAVAARPTPLGMLPAARRNVLQTAVQLRLLRLHGDAADERVGCYHDQVRVAALSAVDALRRRELHAHLARAIEAASDDPEALLRHYEGAGELQRAAGHALRAAELAEAALAFGHAAELCQRFLDLADPGDPLRVPTQVRRSENLAQAGHGRAAAVGFLAAANAKQGQAHLLRTRAAQVLMGSGHLKAGLEQATQVLKAVGLKMPGSQLSAVLGTLWRRLRIRLRGIEPAAGPATPAQLQRLDTCWAVVTGFHSIDPLRASAFQTHHMLDALEAGDPHRLARSFAAEAASLSVGGEKNLARGLDLAERARQIAEELDDPRLMALTHLERGTLYFMCGHWREAEVQLLAALDLIAVHGPGAVWERSTAELFLLDQYIYLGDMDKIAKRADRILRDGAEAGNLLQLTVAMRPLHIARLAQDDPETAMREVSEAIGRWPGEGRVQHFNANWALVQTELYAGQHDAALERVEALWSVLRRAMLLTMEYIRVEMRHARARALLATAQGDRRGPHLKRAERDASALLGELPAWAKPLGLLVRAAVSHARDGDPRADLQAALVAFDDQGMRLYSAATRRRLAELDGDAEDAAQAFAGLAVVNPGRMTAMLAPGFGDG
jgi:eukaryotic-like serine/threonine-protein kinase